MSIEKQLFREAIRRVVHAEQASRPNSGDDSNARAAAIAPQRTRAEAVYYEVKEDGTQWGNGFRWGGSKWGS